MSNIHPSDFDNNHGREQIIRLLHELEVKIHQLEQSFKQLKCKETHLEKDVESI